MATRFQVTIDCADPGRLARFWAEALHYTVQPPPEGFASWDAFLASIGVPEKARNDASAVVDPVGAGPRLYFQRVPEPKATKNRVHLDLNVSGGRAVSRAERQRATDAEARRLMALGATEVERHADDRFDEAWVVLADPEGNEFCLQ